MADVAKMSDLAITRLCAEAMGAAVFRMGDCLYPDKMTRHDGVILCNRLALTRLR